MGFLTRIASHLDLMKEMFRQTGAIGQKGISIYPSPSLRQAISRCSGCENTDACRKWLDFGLELELENRAPPQFCPNAGYQNSLKAGG